MRKDNMNSLPSLLPVPTDRRHALALMAGLALASVASLARGEVGSLATVAGRPSAPPLRLADTEGKPVDISAYAGRVVLVNFWATWCPPCRKEFPSLGRLQKLFRPEDLQVLAVNVGEDADTIFSFAGLTDFPVLLDRDSAAMARWPVRALPTTFVVDRRGQLAYRAVGGREFDDPAVTAQLKQLLK
jgi:thiol-disulfide isomerase/thioredoxin